jgi:hypothetical protein
MLDPTRFVLRSDIGDPPFCGVGSNIPTVGAGTIELPTNWPGISCRKQKIIPALRLKRRWRVSS